MVQPSQSFTCDINHFIEYHKALCIGTLGVSVLIYGIGNLLDRAVTAIGKCMGTTAKVDSQKNMIPNSNNATASLKRKKPIYSRKPTTKELKKTNYIMTCMATYYLPSLLMKRKELEKIGKELEESVHPLRYLTTILTDPKMKGEMLAFRGRGALWPKFIAKFGNRFNSSSEQKYLLNAIDNFAKDHGLDSGSLTRLVKNQQLQIFFDTVLGV
jgi:hypothetical protein